MILKIKTPHNFNFLTHNSADDFLTFQPPYRKVMGFLRPFTNHEKLWSFDTSRITWIFSCMWGGASWLLSICTNTYEQLQMLICHWRVASCWCLIWIDLFLTAKLVTRKTCGDSTVGRYNLLANTHPDKLLTTYQNYLKDSQFSNDKISLGTDLNRP